MNKITTKIYVYIYKFVIPSIEIISFIISMIIIVVVICIISIIIVVVSVVVHCYYYYYYLSKLGSDMFARPKQCGLKNYL